jgi:hypothetical protein
MWDGVTYVDDQHSPIISEGAVATRVIVTNAGPSSVALRGWFVTAPEKGAAPDVQIELWPGNTSSIAAHLIRAKSIDGPSIEHAKHFAAIAWRVVP